MSTILPFNPFATKDLLTLPGLDLRSSDAWHGFKFEASLENDHFSLVETEKIELGTLRTDVLKLSLDDVSLSDLDSSAHSSATASDNDEPIQSQASSLVEHTEDVWKLLSVQKPGVENKLISWDWFLDEEHEEPSTTYMSERGVASFDTLLQKVDSTNQKDKDIRYARYDLLLNALFDLGLGCSSVFFIWNNDIQTFRETYDNYTLSGLSEELLQMVIKQILSVGVQFHRLEQQGRSMVKNDPAKVALIGATTSVLNAVRCFLEDRRASVVSLVQLLELYGRPTVLIELVNELMETAEHTTTRNQLPSSLLTFVEQTCSKHPEMENLVGHMTSRALLPSLTALYNEIGLIRSETYTDGTASNALAKVLPASTTAMIDSAKSSLKVLCDDGAETYPFIMQLSSKYLMIHNSWDAILDLQEQANVYELKSKDAFFGHRKVSQASLASLISNSKIHSNESKINNVDDPFVLNFHIFDSTNLATTEKPGNTEDPLQKAITSVLSGDEDINLGMAITYRQALDLSLTPFLRAQHRLLSYAVMQVLFQNHDLSAHLNVLHRFQLLGDGWFVSRLSTALFDPEQVSGEARRRTKAATGLRLNNRDTWPPASSELRLTLMGILSESLVGEKSNTFVDSVSFAVRELSDEELERCRDVNSIHALDFLRLRYKSPNTVFSHVITPRSLEQYDTIFNHLLRLLRLRALTENLRRETSNRHLTNNRSINSKTKSLKFIHKIHYFITTLSSYSQTTVISLPWSQFQYTMQNLHFRVDQNDYEGTLSLSGSLDELRNTHENVLEDITTGLFLGRRQHRVRKVIEEIMGLILRFASLSSPQGDNDGEKRESETRHIHKEFDDKVLELIALVKRLSADQADGFGSGVWEHLVLALEFNNFYSR